MKPTSVATKKILILTKSIEIYSYLVKIYKIPGKFSEFEFVPKL